MAQRSVVITSPVGLHARPAAVFTKAAAAAGAAGMPVTIRKGDGPAVSAASILAVLTLNVGQGDQVTLETAANNTGKANNTDNTDDTDDDAGAVLDRLVALLATDHP